MESNLFTFKAMTIQGREISMDHFKGRVILVVNTASKCGFTPQYEGLQKIYQKYEDKGFVILGFPCNQFGSQEPGTEKEITDNCLVNYGVTFPMFSKIKVNGPDTHPVFVFLKKKLGGFFGSRIKWNFTKFLVDRNGKPVKRFSPATTPEQIEKSIKSILDIS